MSRSVLPNFLVIGVEKGGTTWLHAQLKKHPDIFLPDTKEVQFFNKYNSNFVAHDYYTLSVNWYLKFFAAYKAQSAIGEITPMYICDTEAPFRIKAVLPGVKLIAMLRNPVQRAYSHYWMAKQKQHTTLSFCEAINGEEPRFIKRGLYYKQLQVYYQLFEPKQILVLFYEEVFKNPEYWLSQICKFLSVDENYYMNDFSVQEKVFEATAYKSAYLLNKQNHLVHAMRRNRVFANVLNWMKHTGLSDRIKQMNKVEKTYDRMSDEDEAKLKNYYKQDLASLSALLERKLPFGYEVV